MQAAALTEAENIPLVLSVTWEDRAGVAGAANRTVGLPGPDVPLSSSAGNSSYPGVYESSGVRKAVVLARYVDLLKDWYGGGGCSRLLWGVPVAAALLWGEAFIVPCWHPTTN